MKPSKVTKAQVLKIATAALYIGASAIIGYFTTLLTEQPELFGVYTPIANLVLVYLKQLFTTEK